MVVPQPAWTPRPNRCHRAGVCLPPHVAEHSCLAVLSALTTLAVALMAVPACRLPAAVGPLRASLSTLITRAPPVGSLRLSQLCILRH